MSTAGSPAVTPQKGHLQHRVRARGWLPVKPEKRWEAQCSAMRLVRPRGHAAGLPPAAPQQHPSPVRSCAGGWKRWELLAFQLLHKDTEEEMGKVFCPCSLCYRDEAEQVPGPRAALLLTPLPHGGERGIPPPAFFTDEGSWVLILCLQYSGFPFSRGTITSRSQKIP